MTRFTEDRARTVAQELTRLDYDGWTYEAKPVKPELCNTGIPLTPSWKVLVYDDERYPMGDLGLELVSLEQAAVAELNEEV